ncbi:MAG: hypothetical protein R3286_13620 [Gammaproteobacteria bacterium]|nr:hypothetical protein [Gammaproteobacteria bacterium]
MLISAWQLIKGMLRQRFLWVGVVVLAPFAAYDAALRDRLPSELRVPLPGAASGIALGLLVIVLFLSVFLAFHRARLEDAAARARLEEEIAALRGRLDKRDRRRRKLERLAAIANEARDLRAARFVSELDWLSWSDSFDRWLAKAREQMEGYFTSDELALFLDASRRRTGAVTGAYSPAHGARLLELDAYIANLEKLMERYEDRPAST